MGFGDAALDMHLDGYKPLKAGKGRDRGKIFRMFKCPGQELGINVCKTKYVFV